MDEEAAPRSAASSDQGYHDDDELAAALAAQLDRLVETGAVPLQRDDSVETPPTAAAAPVASRPRSDRTPVTPPPAAEPPTLTGPLKPPSHRADAPAPAAEPTATVGAPGHSPEHRADRAASRAAHRSDPSRDLTPSAAALPSPGSGEASRPLGPDIVPRETRPLDPSAGQPTPGSTETGGPSADTGSLRMDTGSLRGDTGAIPRDTGSVPLSRRARRAEERARALAQAAGSRRPPTGPVDLPAVPIRGRSRTVQPSGAGAAAPEVDEVPAEATAAPPQPVSVPLSEGPDDGAPHAGPVRRRRSFRPPPELRDGMDAPEPVHQEPETTEAALEVAVPREPESPPPVPSGRPDDGPVAAGDPEGAAPTADPWGRALRIAGHPLPEHEEHRDAGGPESSPIDAGSWFEEPLPTTGTVVLSGSPTGPVPVAEPDDPAEVDEVESDYGALAADTASVGLLPPMVEEAGRRVMPAISRGSLDRERIPEAVAEEPPSPTLRSGLVAPLATWAGALGSPLAIITGFALGGGPTTALGLVLGLALALPAILRLGTVGARQGRDAVAAARAFLGETAGTAAGIVLLVSRVAIAALGLLGVADVATSYAGRTGLGGAVAASGAAILAVLLAGLLALVAASWPGPIVGVVLGAAGAVGLFVSAAMLVVLAGVSGPATTTAPSPVAAAVAGFALVGLVVASGAAEVTRRPLVGTRWRLGVVGTVVGAMVAAGVVALGAAAGGSAAGSSATDAFVGAVVDATSVALVGPIAVLLLLSAVALVATASRAAGTAAVSLLDRGRSTGLGTAAATLVAIAVALAALAGGIGAGSALLRFGPLVAVPLTAVLAALTAAPSLRRGASRAPLVALGVAVLLGWLLVDQLLVPGERSPLLDVVGMQTGSPWRDTPAVGLLAAAIGGAVAGALARLHREGAQDRSTERLPAVQAATPE